MTHESAQIAAGDELGHEEVRFSLLIGERQANQIRVIELRLSANLTAERLNRPRIHLRLRQHLDRLDPPQQKMLSLEDVPHPAVADRVENAIRPERELRPPVPQLLGLPGVEIAQLDQLLAQDVVRKIIERANAR